MNPLTEHFLELSPGRALRVLTGGTPGKPRLLMLHGVNARAEYFDEFLPFLQDEYELILPDFRGHGGSFHSDEDYSLEHFAADIGTLIEREIAGDFRLLGMSLGGRVGLILADRYPQWMQRLVVVDVGPDVDPAGLARIVQAQAALPERFASREALWDFYRLAYRAVTDHYIARIIRCGWREAADGGFCTSYDRRIWRREPADFARDAAGLNARVAGIRVPVLVIRGGNSDILSRADAESFVSRLPDGQLVEIPGTTHGVLLEEPARCAELIRGFFGQLPG